MLDTNRKVREFGQSIVLVTLVFFGLVAMLALILDGGNIYTQRRQAQVAADAGALAGARHLCGDEPNQFAASTEAELIAVDHNQATAAEITWTPEGFIRVTTTINFVPFIAQFIGYSNLSASATAVAGCESPSTGQVLPLTWTCPPPPPDEEDDEEPPEDKLCYFDFPDCDLEDEGCDPPLYVFMNWDHRECIDPPNSLGTDDWLSGDVDCDWDDDGDNDAFVGESNRGWLNLNDGENSSDIDLRNKVFDACVKNIGLGPIAAHDWIPGQEGAGPPVYDAVQDYCIDKKIVIPVFDYPCGKKSNDPEADCILHDEDGYPIISGGASDYFHIIGFASFTITCVHAGPPDRGEKDGLYFPSDGHYETGSLCPGRNDLQLSNPNEFGPSDPMTIEGFLDFNISPDVGGAGGAETGTYIIYLIE
ncbi:pilus assembly protein TadG-related protein [Chloroflexota bacterium]